MCTSTDLLTITSTDETFKKILDKRCREIKKVYVEYKHWSIREGGFQWHNHNPLSNMSKEETFL